MKIKDMDFDAGKILNGYLGLLDRLIRILNLNKDNPVIYDAMNFKTIHEKYKEKSLHVFLGYIYGKYENDEFIKTVARNIITGILIFTKTNLNNLKFIKSIHDRNNFYSEIAMLENSIIKNFSPLF